MIQQDNKSVGKHQIASELFILSAVSLFVELLIIRWMSADIRAFTVFRTFPLVTCFVGLGVGFALGNDKSYRMLPVTILIFCATMKVIEFVGLSSLGFPSVGVFQWNNLVVHAVNWQGIMFSLLLVIFELMPPFGICVAIGARLGTLFNQLAPLNAYSYNILGALTGSVLFQCLANLGFCPWQEMLIPLLVFVWLQFRRHKVELFGLATIVVLPLLFSINQNRPVHPLFSVTRPYEISHSVHWSPYQRIDLSIYGTKKRFFGLELSTNKAFYQYFFNTEPDTPIGKTSLIDCIRLDYALPFKLNNAKSVLVVGAGTGQNVSFALSAGCTDIDAVEIDPGIIHIGKQYNSDYSSPKVHIICDDARHYFSKCRKRYDVIDFSTLDSHTVAGMGSSVRIDSYIYTRESISKALSLLNDNGVIVISFATAAPWLRERLFKTFTEAAGYEPMLLQGKFSNSIFILGKSVRDHSCQVPALYSVQQVSVNNNQRYLTDDWISLCPT